MSQAQNFEVMLLLQGRTLVSRMLERLDQTQPEERCSLEGMRPVAEVHEGAERLQVFALCSDAHWRSKAPLLLRSDFSPSTRGWYYDNTNEVMWEAHIISSTQRLVVVATRPRMD